MEMRGEREIGASRETVWAALTSAEALKACVPGAQEVTGTAEEGFEAVVVQKVGPVKATFRGVVSFADMVRPERLTLSGEGKGGAAGFARGSADVTLTETEAGTLLAYTVEARVGGKLAQLGSRIVDGFARKMADQFFARLEEAIVGPRAADPAPGADAGAGDGPGDKAGDESGGKTARKGWFRRLISRRE